VPKKKSHTDVLREIQAEIRSNANSSKRMLVKTLLRRFGFKSKTKSRTAFLKELLTQAGVNMSADLSDLGRDDWITLYLCREDRDGTAMHSSRTESEDEALGLGPADIAFGADIGADDISDEELLWEGYAYQFDLEAIYDKYGPDQGEDYLKEVVLTALSKLSEHPNPGVRSGPYLIWETDWNLMNAMNRMVTGRVIFITPPYEDRVSKDASVDGEALFDDPIGDVVRPATGYVRLEMAPPLYYGAMPVLRFQNGLIHVLDIDEAELDDFVERLKRVRDEKYRLTDEIYRALRNHST